jgi:hypothetical protein
MRWTETSKQRPDPMKRVCVALPVASQKVKWSLHRATFTGLFFLLDDDEVDKSIAQVPYWSDDVTSPDGGVMY